MLGNEVQILESRTRLGALLLARLSLIQRAFQVVLFVYRHVRRQYIIHDNNADIRLVAQHRGQLELLVAEQAVNSRQQRELAIDQILEQVKNVTGEKCPQELALLILHRFEYVLVIACLIENAPASARIRDLLEIGLAERVHKIHFVHVAFAAQIAETVRRVHFQLEIVEIVGGRAVGARFGKHDILHYLK